MGRTDLTDVVPLSVDVGEVRFRDDGHERDLRRQRREVSAKAKSSMQVLLSTTRTYEKGEKYKRTSYKIVSTHNPLTSNSNAPHSSPLSVSPLGTNTNSTCSAGLKRNDSRKSRYVEGR